MAHRPIRACRLGEMDGIIRTKPAHYPGPKYHAMGFRFFNVIRGYRCMANRLVKVQADLRAAGLPSENRLAWLPA